MKSEKRKEKKNKVKGQQERKIKLNKNKKKINSSGKFIRSFNEDRSMDAHRSAERYE